MSKYIKLKFIKKFKYIWGNFFVYFEEYNMGHKCTFTLLS